LDEASRSSQSPKTLASRAECRRAPRTTRQRRAAIATGIAAVAFTFAGVAVASWLSTGAGAGAGAGQAQTVNGGNAPTATPSGSSVTLTWPQTTLSGGTPVAGYIVKRFTTGGSPLVVGASCSGTIAALGCTETSVPDGTYDYSVTPRQGGWTGIESAKTRVTVDAVLPTIAITFPVASTRYGPNNWDAGCGTAGVGDVCGTAADAAGVTLVRVSFKRSSTNLYWDGASFSSAAEVRFTATGTTSWNYGFPLTNYPSIDDGYTLSATVTDVGNNNVTLTRAYTVDRAAPVTTDNTGSLVPTAPYTWFSTNQTVTLTPVDPATPITTYSTTNGTTPTTGSTTGTSIALTVDGSYTIKYFSVDSVGNTEAVKAGVNQIKIDKVAPTVATLGSPPAASAFIKGTVTLTGSGTDTLSGLYGIEYLQCAGSTCTPATSIGTSTTVAGAYPLAWNTTTLTDGVYRISARVYNNAGLTRTSTIRSINIKNTLPAVTLTAPANNGWATTTRPTLSGAAGNTTGDSTSVAVKIYNGTGTGGTVAYSTSVTRSAATWTATVPLASALTNGNTYTAQATQTDSAGNTGTSTANTFIVDTVAPQVNAVTSTNVGTLGRVDAGDTLVVTFAEALKPSTVAASGTLTFNKIAGNDTFSMTGLINGTITTGTTGKVTASSISYTGTMALSNADKTITLTVGNCTVGCGNAGAGSGSGTVPFAPNPAITDPAGNAATGTFNVTLTLF
jgi:hypothetical protein